MKREDNKKILLYIFSFLIPVFLTFIAYFSIGIYPGSKNLVLTYDLRAQLLPIYGYLSNGGPGFDNLFHSMSGALGGGFFGTIALYVSPFDLIYSFVPVSFIPTVIYFMIIFKIGLCGLFMSIFLNRNEKFGLKWYSILLFSSCYALMSFNFMYSMSPMWYDAVMLLPLIALSSERLISGKKSLLFVLLMTLCILSGYYMAYIVAIALALYVIFRLSEEYYDIKTAVSRFFRFVIHGILSAGLSLVVLIPVILDFKRGKMAEGNVVQSDLIKNTLVDVLISFKPQSYSGLDFNASPNVFCGTVVLLLAVIWLALGKKDIRARVAGLIIVSVYFASFIFGPIDNIWHGFREPVCFSCRYSFTFVFFMICFAVRGLQEAKGILDKYSKSLSSLVFLIVIIYTCSELYINAAYILARIGSENGYAISEEFEKYVDVSENIIPYDRLSDADTYGRVAANYKFSYYDSALFGYDGLSRFSSSYNYGLSDFLRKLGVASSYHITSDMGLTPPVAALLNIRYISSYFSDLSDHYEPVSEYGKYTLYENGNVLPLAFEISSSSLEENELSKDNPFNNINKIYEDITGIRHLDIFSKVEFDTDSLPVFSSRSDPNSFVSTTKEVSFIANNSGLYYLYVEYIPDDDPEPVVGRDEYLRTLKIRNLIIDGSKVFEYGSGNKYNYCVDLGSMEEGSTHILNLESSGDEIGDVQVYYFDEKLFEELVSKINGYKLSSIGKDGIEINGYSANDTSLLLSLPFEDGYSIYVDGKETEYLSYRNALIKVDVSEGEHSIEIRYCPPGLYAGIVFTFISFFLCLVYFNYLNVLNQVILRKKGAST